ncbi:MAG: preprotein translocase subunit SecG [Methylococcales bacterium]
MHILLAAGIIALVLLQQGKGADAGAAFGSGASGTVFGAQGSATFLTRATGVLATLFFATSLGLAVVGDTRQTEAGFMDTPTIESAPTDMPPVQQDLNPAPPVSDMPGLPSGKEDSAGVDETVGKPVSPTASSETVVSPQAANPSDKAMEPAPVKKD